MRICEEKLMYLATAGKKALVQKMHQMRQMRQVLQVSQVPIQLRSYSTDMCTVMHCACQEKYMELHTVVIQNSPACMPAAENISLCQDGHTRHA